MIRSALKSGVKEISFKYNFNGLKLYKKSSYVGLYYTYFTLHPREQLVKNCSREIRLSSFRQNSKQATIEHKTVNDEHSESSFQEELYNRKMQAERSVLIEVAEKEDIPCAFAYCEKFGSIKEAYSYSGEEKDVYLLLEFSTEASVEALLKKCSCKQVPGIIPVNSHIFQYEKKFRTSLSEVRITEESIPKSSLKPGASISEIIQDIYSTEKLTELDIRLRYYFCTLIKKSISGLFPTSEVMPFGSSVNGIGRLGCDLDVVLMLNTKQGDADSELYFVNRTYSGKHKLHQQKTLSVLSEIFRAFLPSIYVIEKVVHARVPILKMYHEILKLQCDFSVDNMTAFQMSNILHFYGEIDDRIRPLMYGIKRWAKDAKVTDSILNSSISNFGLINLVIFFLQNRPNPMVPSLNEALVILGEANGSDLRLKFLKPIEEWKKYASLNTESLAVLLKEFLVFLATSPFQEQILSLMSGKTQTRLQENRIPLWILYPFDENLNITKNISFADFKTMQEKAKISAIYLENYIKQEGNHVNDFCTLLGIPDVSNINAVSEKNHVNSLVKGDKASNLKLLDFKASKKVKHEVL